MSARRAGHSDESQQAANVLGAASPDDLSEMLGQPTGLVDSARIRATSSTAWDVSPSREACSSVAQAPRDDALHSWRPLQGVGFRPQ
jgi:hypothetical protein